MELIKVLTQVLYISLLVIYIIYILILRKSLIKNRLKINNFIRATLICLGISIAFIELNFLLYYIIEDKVSGYAIVMFTILSLAFEKLGIFIDILRLL